MCSLPPRDVDGTRTTSQAVIRHAVRDKGRPDPARTCAAHMYSAMYGVTPPLPAGWLRRWGPPLCSPVTIGLGATCGAALVARQCISASQRLAAPGAGRDCRPSHVALEEQPLRTAENHNNLRPVPMPCVSFFCHLRLHVGGLEGIAGWLRPPPAVVPMHLTVGPNEVQQ